MSSAVIIENGHHFLECPYELLEAIRKVAKENEKVSVFVVRPADEYQEKTQYFQIDFIYDGINAFPVFESGKEIKYEDLPDEVKKRLEEVDNV